MLKTEKTIEKYKLISNIGIRSNLNIKAFNELTFSIPSLQEKKQNRQFLILNG